MKSKSFELPKNSPEKVNQNKTYDFVKFYKSGADSNVKLLESHKTNESSSTNVNNDSKTKSLIPRKERSANKNKKKNKSDNVEIDGTNLVTGSGLNGPKLCTSTPNIAQKKDENRNFKSIMKNKPTMELDETLDTSHVSINSAKPKKRNKSVSFMLDDTEELAIKRTKSEESILDKKKSKDFKKDKLEAKKLKKLKKKTRDEKENKSNLNKLKIDTDKSDNVKENSQKQKSKSEKVQSQPLEPIDVPIVENQSNGKLDKKRKNKPKKGKPVDINMDQEAKTDKTETDETKKKLKKKKRKAKTSKDSTETEDEPATKTRKKDLKPEIIAEGLENLNIGDNPHTLTNLLDEMTVVDKNKKKKNKPKQKKNNAEKPTANTESDQQQEEKEKVKWMKRKWNKDKKGGVNEDKLLTTIVVENLPLRIMCTYKKLLAEHFAKFGLIRQVGVAEVYPTEDPKPVFSTTITFYSEDAANKSLEDDNSVLEGNRIRVKQPLPPTQTTVVVRSYAELTEQALSSLFTGAGRIRNIRHLVKGKKTMSTVFIEFDGPGAVKKALKMAEEVKICGKKIHVAKFELRNTNKVKNTETNPAKQSSTDNKNNEDSDDSDE